MAEAQAMRFWSYCDELVERLGIHCGLPQGIGENHITTTYEPLAQLLKDLNPKRGEEEKLESVVDSAGSEWKLGNHWRVSRQWRGHFGRAIILKRYEGEKLKCRLAFLPKQPSHLRLDMIMGTLACRTTYALGESEKQAQKRLFRELDERQRNQYITSDSFAETGRSGVMYVIRKSRPTIAIRKELDGGGAALCTLCLHPVAYYTATWAGVLPPSDEALTHLLMIRQSEHFYWRKANQIPLDEETSGV